MEKISCHAILKVLSDIFCYIDGAKELKDLDNDVCLGDADWTELRNNSSFMAFDDSQDFEEIESDDMSGSDHSTCNSSSFLNI